MAVTAAVSVDKANAVAGQIVNGLVTVTDSAGTNPIDVDKIQVFYTGQSGRAQQPINCDLFTGATAGKDQPKVIPFTLNINSSLRFGFATTARGAEAPGSTAVTMTLGATVYLSDGTALSASTTTFNVNPVRTDRY